MDPSRDLEAIRRLIAARKRYDALFGVLGLIALMIGVLTFVALFADMAWNGMGRLERDFFTHFPSRRPAQAGMLSGWVVTKLAMLITSFFAVTPGVAPGIYAQWRERKDRDPAPFLINTTHTAS